MEVIWRTGDPRYGLLTEARSELVRYHPVGRGSRKRERSRADRFGQQAAYGAQMLSDGTASTWGLAKGNLLPIGDTLGPSNT